MNCFKPNPLRRNGTSQQQRTLKMLLPDYVKVDERDMRNLLVFIEKYAGLINFYNDSNIPAGDWTEFFSSDYSTVLASVSLSDYQSPVITFDKFRRKMETDNSPDHIKTLFDITFSLLRGIDGWMETQLLQTPLRSVLISEITGVLRAEMQALIAAWKFGSVSGALVNVAHFENPADEEFVFSNTTDILAGVFHKTWYDHTPATSWAAWYASVGASGTAFGNPIWSNAERRDFFLSYIKGYFSRIFGSLVRIIQEAQTLFDKSLTDYPWHQPQNALALTFLKLFGTAQTELNDFTRRHLEFYFRDVLRLKEKPIQPDNVFAVFEPSVHKDRTLVKKSSGLKAGKDDKGKEVTFYTDADLSVNKSLVDGLKTIRFSKKNPYGFFDAPIANSKDGLGKELEPDQLSWYTFGKDQPGAPSLLEGMQISTTGFALSSRVFQAKEGKRVFELLLFFEKTTGVPPTIDADYFTKFFKVSISGEKGWIDMGELAYDASPTAPNTIIGADSFWFIPFPIMFVRLTLEPGHPPLVAPSEKVHGPTVHSQYPIIRFELVKQDTQKIFDSIKGMKMILGLFNLKVFGAKDFIVETDSGPADPRKPFMPFGARPLVGSTFMLGSDEVFGKSLNSIKLNIKWGGLPSVSFSNHYSYLRQKYPTPPAAPKTDTLRYVTTDAGTTSLDNGAFKVQASGLVDGSWTAPKLCTLFQPLGDVSAPSTLSYLDLSSSHLPQGNRREQNSFSRYSNDLKWGFVKFRLSNPPLAFGHSKFSDAYASQSIFIGKHYYDEFSTLPVEPYTPLIESFSVDYEAQDHLLLFGATVSGDAHLYHLFPFGYQEINDSVGNYLLPRFYQTDKSNTHVDILGALHIGIKNAVKDEVVNLLLQFAEGSEDNISLDPGNIFIAYLSGGKWKLLDNYILAEGTKGMIQSGILTFTVPRDMDTEHSLMPTGVRWLRISAVDNLEAFPRLLGVHANAVEATFLDAGNDPLRLEKPLAAGVISKLALPDSAIRKVSQPYNSFGGRPAEKPAAFYTRVSERLRHKDRGITIWDYERMILEQFPYLYKVKCLNHTDDTTEIAPGAIRIIVIPDMKGRISGNRLEPGISPNRRLEILEFIRKKMNTFTDIEVENPQYEKINVQCEVAFVKGKDRLLFTKILEADIDRFLAPWAFDDGRDINFGGQLHRSVVINYIENLPYIDYVTDFTLKAINKDGALLTNLTEFTASDSKCILTSGQNHYLGDNPCAS